MRSISALAAAGRKDIVDAEKLLGRALPCHLEAERAVLGSILFNDEHLPAVCEIISAEDFYAPSHKAIFSACVTITQGHRRIDLVTLQDELEKMGKLSECGGLVYLVSLQEDLPLVGLVVQHAKIIKEKSILRKLIHSATQIIGQCYMQSDKGIEAMLDEAEKTIFNISAQRSPSNFVQLTIWLNKTFQQLSQLKGHGKGVTGISSGYKILDEMTSGFQKGDLVVLAARPSMGKTALALSLARNAAAQGGTVGFFSLEMGGEQLMLRLLSSESGIPHQAIRNASITSDEWMDLADVAGRLAEVKIFIDDTAMQSVMDVRAKARKLKAEHNLQFLVIDYLQLLHSTKQHENRHQEVSEISRSLKALAKELGIPIVALSQLSRAVDSRMDKRPMLSDLRESGAIEQDADLIMFLYRDIVYNNDAEDPQLAELIIGKQRNGPTGTVYLHFQNDITLFQDKE